MKRFTRAMASIGFTALSYGVANANEITNRELAYYGHDPRQFSQGMQDGIAKAIYNVQTGTGFRSSDLNNMSDSAMVGFGFGYQCIEDSMINNRSVYGETQFQRNYDLLLGNAYAYCVDRINEVARLAPKPRF